MAPEPEAVAQLARFLAVVHLAYLRIVGEEERVRELAQVGQVDVRAPALKAVADAVECVRDIAFEPAHRAHDQLQADAACPEPCEAIPLVGVAGRLKQRPHPGRMRMGGAQHRPRLALQLRLAADLELDGIAHDGAMLTRAERGFVSGAVSPQGGVGRGRGVTYEP
jgi:hypothetical protein